MTRLTLLGTGHAMVTRCYNTCFTLCNGAETLLVDAGGGNGILARIEESGTDWRSIGAMFVTHTHTDHILGAVWVVRKIASLIDTGRYAGTFRVYGHEGVIRALDTLCRTTLAPKFLAPIGSRIRWIVVADGSRHDIAGMELTFFDIASTKTPQFGFEALLPDSRRLVCLGDEPFREAARPYAAGCDWLLCEAYCTYADRERFRPYEKHHSTALDAARTASELGIGHLLLYHTEDSDLASRREKYIREARQCFDGDIRVPEDLERIDL